MAYVNYRFGVPRVRKLRNENYMPLGQLFTTPCNVTDKTTGMSTYSPWSNAMEVADRLLVEGGVSEGVSGVPSDDTGYLYNYGLRFSTKKGSPSPWSSFHPERQRHAFVNYEMAEYSAYYTSPCKYFPLHAMRLMQHIDRHTATAQLITFVYVFLFIKRVFAFVYVFLSQI